MPHAKMLKSLRTSAYRGVGNVHQDEQRACADPVESADGLISTENSVYESVQLKLLD